MRSLLKRTSEVIRASIVLSLGFMMASGGTAAALPGSNTVTGGDIVTSTITSSDLRSSSVGSSEIASSAVGASEIATGAVTSSELANDVTVTTLTADAIFASAIFNTEFLNLGNSVVTAIPDSGDASPAAFALDSTQAWAFLGFDCQDTDGCNVSLEQDFTDGDVMFVYNAGANAVNFSDVAEQSELAGNFATGQWDTLQVIFRDDTVTNSWLEVSRSDN